MIVKKLLHSLLCIGVVTANSFYTSGPKGRRSPEETLYRGEVTAETGGKVPETLHLRSEFNKIDAMGFDDPHATRMVEQLKDSHLPEKIPDSGFGSLSPSSRPGRPSPSNFPTEFQQNFADDFPFNPAFDAHKLNAGPNPDEEIEISKSVFSGNDIYADKPHLYTPDPYENPQHYTNPSSDYYQPEQPSYPESGYGQPPYGGYNQEPYQPYNEPYHTPAVSSYQEPEPYHPPTSGYGPPPSSGYGVPSSGYGAPEPYKPKGPVMLDKRPYEPKEIKPVTITTHETYTGFDCRAVPYPDRHYADPEAGCAIYHYCHSDGKQDTFHCPYGTIFNEYLGTCDHSGAVYCKGGEGYAGPPKHNNYAHPEYHHHPEPAYNPHQPSTYHDPGSSYGSGFGSGFDFPKGFGGGF